MGKFAVIDTETNWHDEVMSIGVVIAQEETFQPISVHYHILPEAAYIGGMFSHTLYIDTPVNPVICDRNTAISQLVGIFRGAGVRKIFAYNAGFDKKHLPELRDFTWYDIMALAAYRQYNPKIPSCADCYGTGRMKRGFGVEAMLRLLSGRQVYCETHNACHDAIDELEIMRLLGHPTSVYTPLK